MMVAFTDNEAGALRVRHGALWRRVLVWFLRLVALYQIAKGMHHWSVLLDIGNDGGRGFSGAGQGYQTAIVWFAVIDLVAGVGLWLLSSWGAVIWLLAAASYIKVRFMLPVVFGGPDWSTAVLVGLIGFYIALSWQAARTVQPVL